MEKVFVCQIPYQNELYAIKVTRRRTHSYSIRYLKDGSFSMSVPSLTSQRVALEMANKLLPRLLKSISRKRNNSKETPYGEDYLYELGDKHNLSFANEKQRKDYIKKTFLPIITSRVRYYEKLMGIQSPYKIILRDMSSEWGSNSKKTYRLAFSISLYYFQMEVIDSVVIHELAHHYQMNHSSRFYKIVYQYCPKYDKCHAKLRRKEYERDPNL